MVHGAMELVANEGSWLYRMMATVELCQHMTAVEVSVPVSEHAMKLAVDHRRREFQALLKEKRHSPREGR